MLMVKLDVYYLSFKKIIYKKNIKKKKCTALDNNALGETGCNR